MTQAATGVAVVTGAANGIGYAAASALAAEGYAVAMFDVVSPAQSADRISATGARAVGFEVDVADAASVAAALAQVKQTLGTPTAVFTAAGIANPSPFLELSVESWDRTVRVNLTGTFLVLQGCARMMVDAGVSGSMVAVASLSGRGPSPDNSDYAASKAGVISLVKSAAVTLAPHGIRVNALCPGVIDTAFTTRMVDRRAAASGLEPEQVIADMVSKVPLGRWASPDEVASVGVQLIGENFSYVTGQAVNICGGLQFN